MRSSNIALLIPYFEAGDGLVQSLESVKLRQQDLILVVDDGSTLRPAAEFCPDSVGVTPVQLLSLSANQGITGALIAGMQAVPKDFEYIGRLDCGDICHDDRFELQREFLDENPEVGIVGSWADFVKPNLDYLYTEKYPTTHAAVTRRMRVNSAFCHPAVLFRKDVYESTQGYSFDFPAAEDYALFREMLTIKQGQNLELSLIKCLTSDGGISQKSRRTQILSRIKIMIRFFDWHPMSFYGVARATLQFFTPRTLTTAIKKGWGHK